MTYSFVCNGCNTSFDVVYQNFYMTGFEMPDCPICKNNFNVNRIWYVPQIIYKGSGWTIKKGEISKR